MPECRREGKNGARQDRRVTGANARRGAGHSGRLAGAHRACNPRTLSHLAAVTIQRDCRSRLLTLDALHKAMVEREGRLRMALEAAEMVTWAWDLRTNIIQYSDNISTLVAGTTIAPYCTVEGVLQTIHPEDRDGLAAALGRAMREGTPFACEYRALMQDGAYHWILGKGRIVLVEDGRPVKVLGVSQDITVRKRLEQELQMRTQQLAELAAKLTIVEHQERQRCADLLHEDLQQILAGARMLVDGVRHGAGDQRAAVRKLDQALKQAQDVARSVTRMLFPPLSLQKDLPLALRWLAIDMGERHRLEVAVRSTTNFPAIPEPVAVLVFTAARELLLNIVKHSGTLQCRLHLRLRRDALELEVQDAGRGSERRVFGEVRADPGFGHFSIRERAELLGGRFDVASAPGRGMRVLLSVPCRIDARTPPRRSGGRRAAKQPATASRKVRAPG